MLRSKAAQAVSLTGAQAFQSLFSWMLRSKSRHPVYVLPPLRVSILVLVDVALEALDVEIAETVDNCFNPCSRGCCARRIHSPSSGKDILVSILVLVDVALEVPTRQRITRSKWVSILVLVDVALEAKHILMPANLAEVSILVLVDVALEGAFPGQLEYPFQFQSLFSWMLRSKIHPRRGWRGNARFQSLFSWMLRSKNRAARIMRNPSSCFNPCSRGCCARSPTYQIVRSRAVGFNPCSRGCCARSRRIGSCHCDPHRVSILVLVDVALEDEGEEPSLEVKAQYVSILVLVDVALEEIGDLCFGGEQTGFNPCSRGCCARSRQVGYWIRRVITVSILVLVDVALEDIIGSLSQKPSIVSILVLVDVALEENEKHFPIFVMTCFNPCSRGCCARRFTGFLWRWMKTSFNPCSRGCCARRPVTTKTAQKW